MNTASAIDKILSAVLEADEDFDAGFDAKEAGHPGEYGEILDLLNRGILDLSMRVDRIDNHHVHQRSTTVDYEVRFNWDDTEDHLEEEARVMAVIETLDAWLKDRMVDWNNKIYREIEAEWDSRLEDAYLIDEIEANEWKFKRDGTLVYHERGIPFERLTPEARETAIEGVRQSKYEDPDNDPSEYVVKEWKWLLTNKGFGNIEINYSGFSSQGDGASFTGKVVDWNLFFNGHDPLEFPESEREQMDEALEDEEDDLKDLNRSDRKPWGYILRSRYQHVDATGKAWPSNYPWMNKNWSNASNACGNFRRWIGDATVFKRRSTAQQYSELEIVPVYDNPRVYGEKVLDPLFVAKPSHTFRTLQPGEPLEPLGERHGGAKHERALFYHGTSAALIPKIMAEGLIPDPKKRVWGEDPNTSITSTTRKTTFGIGLTRNFGSAVSDGGLAARRDKTNLAIICVAAQPRSLIADEDDVGPYVKAVIPHLADSVYHHIWPYFFEVYRGQYEASQIAEAFEEDDDMDAKELTSRYVNDYYTQAADKQKAEWIEGAVTGIAHKMREPAPQLLDRVRQLLADEGYAVMLTRAASYASKSEHGKRDWDSEWRRFFKNIEPPPIPDPNQAEHAWHMFTEKLARTLKDYARKGQRNPDANWDVSARATQPIGFSGSNHIVCVVEQVTEREPSYHSRMLVHYGKPPRKLIEDWNSSTGKLEPGDIVYKNVQEGIEGDEDFKDIIEPPRIFVRWVWTQDVSAHMDQVPRLYQGEPYQHSQHEQGPFHSYEHGYEWARVQFSDCRDKMDSIDLIALSDKDTIVNAYFIAQDWEMKRFGDLPNGENTVYKESLEDDSDVKEITGSPQRWLYLVNAREFNPRSRYIEYYITDSPDYQFPTTHSGHIDYAKMRDDMRAGKVRRVGAEPTPRNTKESDIHLTAQAQIRQFQKTGEYVPGPAGPHSNLWDWMKAARQRPNEK